VTHRLSVPFILGLSILASVAPAAEAAIVFTNFGPLSAYDVTSGNPAGNAFDGNDYAEGNTFTPLNSGALISFRIALSCAFACPDSFGVFLTADAGDQPGTVLESFTVPGLSLGALGINNAPILLTSVLMPHLTTGTQYWVSLTAPLTDSVAWNLNSSGDVSDQAISTDGGSNWFSPSGLTPGALEVNASAPEPVTFTLLAGGGLLLAAFRRRRAR
jgi:hypothetical protein